MARADSPSGTLLRRGWLGVTGKDAFMSPRFRGEGWLLRLSRLVEDPIRL